MKSYLKKSRVDDTYYENLKDWNSVYIPFLNDFFIDAKVDWDREPYKDPDSIETGAEEFYKAMTFFLQAQEASHRNLLNGHFKYEFDFPYIKVEKETNTEGEYEHLFYLKSDQFGFSRPSKDKSHPYDTYIEKSKNKKNAIENVSRWIYESRTIGGAFLWPLEVNQKGELNNNPPYNINRGGSCKKGNYIEDRVDLTLLEIMMVLEGKQNDKVILKKASGNDTNMKKWLNHFTSFDVYASFFCFDKFFCLKEKGIKKGLINIIASDIEQKNYIELSEEDIGKKGIYEPQKLKFKHVSEFERILKNVNLLIKKRTEEMEKIIRLERFATMIKK